VQRALGAVSYHLDLGNIALLVPLDKYKTEACAVALCYLDGRKALRIGAHDREVPIVRDDAQGGAGLTVAEGILPGNVHPEIMLHVFNDCNFNAPFAPIADEALDEGRFTGARPAYDGKYMWHNPVYPGRGHHVKEFMDERTEHIPAFIVAGGKSSRFGGDKTLYPFEGIPLIERVTGVLARVFTDITIVANDAARFSYLGLPSIPDAVQGMGPMGGIYTALLEKKRPWIFVVASDMPFLDASLIRYMCALTDDCDIVVPIIDGYYEGLHALYSARCLEPVSRFVKEGRRQIVSFFPEVRVRKVQEDEIRAFAEPSRVFHNINFRHDITTGTP
jgi:molybdenum cofactor guanylyltransferase